jgi:hypothetical protein
MQFDYRYLGSSAVDSGVNDTSMSFVPDASREPTFFNGALGKKIAFREAISALHKVVTSDMRYKAKDRTQYFEWLEQQDFLNWQAIAKERQDLLDRIEPKQEELNLLRRESRARRGEFEKAKRRYFDYLYRVNYDAWFVLDPVITVHPDVIFFECFSQDESSYGKLSCRYEVFEKINEFGCGTTNIDYSYKLYNEFQKIRHYKETKLEVDPGGFNVKTEGEEDYREVKIDLPDTWVRGFLQVSSAMTLPAKKVDLHPLDIYSMCSVLRRFKEKKGPRSMRFILKPGHPVVVRFDPWGTELVLHRSPYLGDSEDEIRVWGRRRIHILERLIPVAEKFTLYLLGRGLPYFYVADLGDMTFTLGLSGWTSNDWSSSGNFDLLAPRMDVDELTKRRVFDGLKEDWLNTPDKLAKKLSLDRNVVLGALSAYTQAGRVIFDLDRQVFRARELSRDPLPEEKLRFSNEREEKATRYLNENKVGITSMQEQGGGVTLEAKVEGAGKSYEPRVVINADDRITEASCNCSYYRQNKLMRGPCEHILATRLWFSRQKRS